MVQFAGSRSRGYYDNTGFHNPINSNIIVGQTGNDRFRNFFVFNIPTLMAGQFYTSATLQLQLSNNFFSLAGQYGGADPTETYDLRNVSTPIATLTAGGSGLTGIYNDLADGTSYGTRDFSSADNDTTVNMTINAAGLSAINTNVGSQFALGGFLSTISGTAPQYAFGSSDVASTAGSSLVLTASPAAVGAPEPGTLRLIGMGLVSGGASMMGVVRRRWASSRVQDKNAGSGPLTPTPFGLAR